MTSFRKYQNVRLLNEDKTVASSDYVLEDYYVRVRDGLLTNVICVEDGEEVILPAIESLDGRHREYWEHGKLHRVDGPAVIDLDDDYEEWWLEGKRVANPNEKKQAINII